MAISFVKSISSSIKTSPYSDGYHNRISRPDTVSDTEDDDTNQTAQSLDTDVIAFSLSNHSALSYKPEYGGPFYLLSHSIWPHDIIADLSQPEDSQPPYQFDEYGFIIESNKEVNDKSCDTEISGESINEFKLKNAKEYDDELRLKWISYLEFTYNENALPKMKWSQIEQIMKHTRVLDELIKMGIPNVMRPYIWMRISKAMTLKTNCNWSYAQMSDLSSHVPSLSDKQFLSVLPTNSCFMNNTSMGIERLRRILRIIKWLQKSGDDAFTMAQESVNLPLIAAFLLLVCDEEIAFWITLAVSNEWKNFDHQKILRSLVSDHCTRIDESLKEHDIELSLITLQWFSALYGGFIHNSKILFHLWDQYFYNGPIVLFQITIGLLLSCEEFVAQCQDSAAVFNALSDLPSKIKDAHSLIKMINYGSELVQYLPMAKPSYSLNEFQSKTMRTSISLLSIPSVNENAETDLKTKNIRQTTIFVELHDAIVAIGKHFESYHPEFKANLIPDYDFLNNLDNEDDDEMIESRPRFNHRRAKALIDFQRHDPDELGFRKNDIITIISERDEHCWIGELNGHRGWFPAKFVEVLNERNHDYSAAGDDRVTPFINDLVRGRFYSSFKTILSYGMRKTLFIHTHPWIIIETIASSCVETDFTSVYSRLVLTRTYRLDEFARVLTPIETLYRSIAHINNTHENEPMDVKLRSLLCIALNQQILHEWFCVICTAQPQVISKWYYNWSVLNSPAWKMIKAELRLLKQFPFNLNPNSELPENLQPKSPVSKDGVRDMLVKHHLFSWDI